MKSWYIGYIPTIKETGRKVGTLWQIWTASILILKLLQNIPVTKLACYRLADVYLMRAEANAEINSDPSAANHDINILKIELE